MSDFQRKSLDNILPGDKPAEQPEQQPATETQPAASEGVEAEKPESGEEKTVPLAALQAERAKAKRYTEQVAAFEQTIKDRDAAWERRFEALLGKLTPQQQEQEAPDPFTDFGGAVSHQVAPYFQPIANELGQVRNVLANLQAAAVFGGEEPLNEFKQFVLEAQQKGDPAYAELSAAMEAAGQSGRNPYAVGKEWFARHKLVKDIGTDPAAYREKLKAEILAEMKGEGGDGKPNPAAPVMPSNLAQARNVGTRAGPAWAGPKPLADIFKR